MTSADAVIAALRTEHDALAALVAAFGDDDLARPSGAAEWDVSQVLSHLGSGAEIGRAALLAALDGKPAPGQDAMRQIWDRWDAMTRAQRATGFLTSNQTLTSLYESLDPATRESLRVELGYLPAPLDLAALGRLRLSEVALHAWDVRVAFDEHAVLGTAAVPELLDGLPGLIGLVGRPEPLGGRRATVHVTTTGPASELTLHLDSPVSVRPGVPGAADGTLLLPAESWLRLVGGRLGARHTPDGVVTTGAADLDLLRQVFPGY